MSELPPIRALLEREGLWANKGLGQHFLLDLNLTRRIARAAGDVAGKPVIEVGPGPGGLTRALLEAGADPLIAIERDARFLPILEELRPWSNDRLKLVHADALEVDEAELLRRFTSATAHPPSPQRGEGREGGRAGQGASGAATFKSERPLPQPAPQGEGAMKAAIVANLPYNVATPLLVKWLKAGPWLDPIVLMFQREVAERIVARPGSSAYGRLSVLAQARRHAALLFTAPARAFVPPPKVTSAVVRLIARADAFADIEALERVTAAAFGRRRKMLRAALKSLAPDPDALLAAAGLPATARAEEIGIDDFRTLAATWRKAQTQA